MGRSQSQLNDLEKEVQPLDAARAKVAADKAYIEQQKTAGAILKEQAESQKKLNEEIEKLREAVKTAQQKVAETTTIAGIKNDATGYVANENASTEVLKVLASMGTGKINAAQTAEIAAIAAMIEKAHGNSVMILNMILDGNQKHETLEQIITSIQAQLAHGRNTTSG